MRIFRKITENELAEKCNVKLENVLSWENGKTVPNAKEMLKLALDMAFP